jgi:hypothetical protein
VDKGYSVRETERMVARELNPPPRKGERKADRDLLRLEAELSDRLGATVKISANRKGSGQLDHSFRQPRSARRLLAVSVKVALKSRRWRYGDLVTCQPKMARCNINLLTTHDQCPIFAGFWKRPGLIDV